MSAHSITRIFSPKPGHRKSPVDDFLNQFTYKEHNRIFEFDHFLIAFEAFAKDLSRENMSCAAITFFDPILGKAVLLDPPISATSPQGKG